MLFEETGYSKEYDAGNDVSAQTSISFLVIHGNQYIVSIHQIQTTSFTRSPILAKLVFLTSSTYVQQEGRTLPDSGSNS
jgi:hypothetical protein